MKPPVASASLVIGLAVLRDETAALAPAGAGEAVARPGAEGAEQHHLAQREDGDAEDEGLAEERPPGDDGGVLVELRRQRRLAVGVVGRHRVAAGDDLVVGEVAAPEREREAEPEQREGERAAEPGVARADDEADDERDRAADGRDDAQADRPGRHVRTPALSGSRSRRSRPPATARRARRRRGSAAGARRRRRRPRAPARGSRDRSPPGDGGSGASTWTYSATEVCCRTSKVLPANAGMLPRPRIMAASASAAGYRRMLGALLPAGIAPPLPVALWQPAQYRRKRSPPGATSAVRDSGSASSCGDVLGDRVDVLVGEHLAERAAC